MNQRTGSSSGERMLALLLCAGVLARLGWGLLLAVLSLWALLSA